MNYKVSLLKLLSLLSISLLSVSCSASSDKSSDSDENSRDEKMMSDSPGIHNGHEYVDLGLSVLWAKNNIGANFPMDVGSYYAWGETKTKSDYTEDNCETYGLWHADISGAPNDVAHTKWGKKWRMPTKAEFEELLENCEWDWRSEINAYVVKSKINGDSIFIPFAKEYEFEKIPVGGWVYIGGGYWTSTPSGEFANLAYSLDYKYNSVLECDVSGVFRSMGNHVRPVADKGEYTPRERDTRDFSKGDAPNDVPNVNGHEYVDMGLSVRWATCNLGANSPSNYGKYYHWGIVSESTGTYESWVYGKEINFGSDIGGKSSRDAATANWGKAWRMPTREEFEELIKECDWTWVNQDGHNGYLVKSRRNSNSIFLPAAGYNLKDFIGESGIYMTSAVLDRGFFEGLWFDASKINIKSGDCIWSYSIRPVTKSH